jgi:hypothetical protein
MAEPDLGLEEGGTALRMAAPYLLHPAPGKVLVIGAGGGKNVATALQYGAREVVALDVNPAVFEVMDTTFGAFTGYLYRDPRVRTVVAEGRHFLETTEETFDAIIIQGVHTGGRISLAHAQVLEANLFTREALRAAFARLTPGGVLYIDEYELLLGRGGATLVRLLAQSALGTLPWTDARRQLVTYVYEGRWGRRREALLASPTPFDPTRLETLSAALSAQGGRLLDPARLPPVDTVPPITDDRPFIRQYVPAAVRSWTLLEGRTWLPLILVVAVVAALGVGLRQRVSVSSRRCVTLGLTGAGYMFMVTGVAAEVGLALGVPHVTAPVVFTALFASSLLGGLWTLQRGADVRAVWATTALAAALIAAPAVLAAAMPALLGVHSVALRVALSIGGVGVYGALAEVPYVHLLAAVQGRARAVAFAWEGLGSLVAAPLAALVAVSLGHTWTFGAAALAYGAAAGLMTRGAVEPVGA